MDPTVGELMTNTYQLPKPGALIIGGDCSACLELLHILQEACSTDIPVFLSAHHEMTSCFRLLEAAEVMERHLW